MVTSVANTNSASNPTSNTAADSSKFSTDYTTFLNLLTAQVKNQDPLSPMDTTEWTNQLVQYSSVEQQIKANGYLETIANASGASGSMTSAVSSSARATSCAASAPRGRVPAIGRTVTSPSSTRTRISGELPMTWMSSQCR